LEAGEEPPGEEQAQGDHHGAVAETVDVPGDGGKVRGQGVLVHARALKTVGEGVDEGGDEGEQVGQDAHRSGDLPVDVFAGDEDAPEPVGEDVHGATTERRLFNSCFSQTHLAQRNLQHK